jgi:poly(3-hydroxybutyrate) depolymerase
MRLRSLSLALLLGTLGAGPALAADPLGHYPIDPTQISVSGISSGAFMANQLHVAHSADIMGVGMVAGGLYGCTVASVDDQGVTTLASLATGACMTSPALLRPVEHYVGQIQRFAAAGWIDPVENIGRSRLYAFTGQSDHVVNPETVRRGVNVYGLLGLPAAETIFRNEDLPAPGAGHSWVTPRFGGACDANAAPYINNCHYDQAGQVLSTLYGPLQPAAAQPGGRIVEFDQTPFVPGGATAANGLLDTGTIYVPAACQDVPAAQGAPACRLHVVLHGCLQSAEVLGDTFYRNIGMNEWADSNRIVVLYPQARSVGVQDFPTPRATDIFNINPNGCWNWWGYAYDTRYLFKDGVQISAIWAMVQQVSGRSNQ